MSRGAWFVAGAGVGVYAVARARRAAEVLTPEGLADRLSGLAVGVRLFTDEVRAGREEKETDLRERLGLASERQTALEAGTTPTPAGTPDPRQPEPVTDPSTSPMTSPMTRESTH